MKFGRNYSLSVEVAGGQFLTIGLPYAVEFDIHRDTLAASQTASFKILNLAEANRNILWKDQYLVTQFRAIQFRAGYGNFMPMLFNGTVKQAYSEKLENTVNGTTIIEAYDGAFQITNGITSTTIAAGQTAAQTIAQLAATLPGITGKPIVGSFPVATKRGEVLFGNTWDLILKKSGGLGCIDQGQPKILNLNDTVTGAIPLISSATGLLGSPARSNAMITFEMVFEPRLTIGQALQLQSTFNPILNGIYKVMGFHHHGRITDSGDASTAKTTVSLWLGTQALNPIAGVIVQ